ncbi:hypothetical protein DQ04_05851070 [Trypanosoma grayi]|uniref:hypothetical protein n=1 Tax=Trypanosoma grayi TaxID=71804 RepID=UPI0004F49C7E|nr:hypothetical protein DQ04_05851070 [Trypanosoma grayi]KEG09088.1 hypothetical protein DQ04_05851070 [Trypanosoma grayi]
MRRRGARRHVRKVMLWWQLQLRVRRLALELHAEAATADDRHLNHIAHLNQLCGPEAHLKVEGHAAAELHWIWEGHEEGRLPQRLFILYCLCSGIYIPDSYVPHVFVVRLPVPPHNAANAVNAKLASALLPAARNA